MSELTAQEIHSFLSKYGHGSQGQKYLEILGILAPFTEACETEVGIQILNRIYNKYQNAYANVMGKSTKATGEDWATLNAYAEILRDISERLNAHKTNLNKIRENIT